MNKSKVWVTDRVNNFSFEKGDVVYLARKKINGYPKFLDFETSYVVYEVAGDKIVIHESSKVANIRNNHKIHHSYLISRQVLRDETIKDLLSD
jgi:hypothetical protein